MIRFLTAITGLMALVTGSPVDPELVNRGTTSFWYSNMDHTGSARGYAPDLDPDFSYPVYKAVSPGDGPGIQIAINQGTDGSADRHGEWLASQPRVCQFAGVMNWD